jgi:hypothetical protein
MPRGSYAKAKGRREAGRFIALPHCCLEHDNFVRMSSKAVKLLVDICLQYNGHNNGDLTVAFSIMKTRGWKSKQTLFLAKEELLHYGWIICTRTALSQRTANLYAVTFRPIDDCRGKLDIKSTKVAPHNWKTEVIPWTVPEKYRKESKRNQGKEPVRNPYHGGTKIVPMNQGSRHVR